MGHCSAKLGVSALPVHVFDPKSDISDKTIQGACGGCVDATRSTNDSGDIPLSETSLGQTHLRVSHNTSQSFTFGSRHRMFSPHHCREPSTTPHSWYGQDMYVKKSSSWKPFGKKKGVVPVITQMPRDDRVFMVQRINKNGINIQEMENKFKEHSEAIMKRHNHDVSYLRELVTNLHVQLCELKASHKARKNISSLKSLF